MGYTDAKKEYVIDDMYPRRPWMNYLWNEEYIAVINQFGFGKGLMQGENNYQRDVVRDTDSRVIYIKDGDHIYAANRNYAGEPFDLFNTVVGIGYTTVISECRGLRCEMTILVPHRGKRECWRVKLTNLLDVDRAFDLYAYTELNVNMTEHLSCSEAYYDEQLGGVYHTHHAYGSPSSYHVVHLATDARVVAFETAHRRFIGTYGNRLTPDGIKLDKLPCQNNSFDADTIAALQSKISLAAGQTTTLYYTVGVEQNLADARTNSAAALGEANFNNELAILRRQADQYDCKVLVSTPDAEVDRFANIWLKRQMDLGKTWGRVYNKGFRDIMQDISGFTQLDPAVCRDKIVDCTQYQKTDGNTLRSWVPLDLRPYRDGAVWMLMSVVTYIKETMDLSVLDEQIGYYGSNIKESLFNHCIRALDYFYREVGEHGLCLWGGGDWNDSFDGAGLNMRGESVWLSIAAVKGTNDFLTLLERIGRTDLVNKYTALRDGMISNINKHGWDKDHYIYGINDWGEKVGSYDTAEGQIFLNPQSWAVLAGIGDAKQLLDLVEREMGCDYGYVQQKPCYTTPDPHVGRISYFGKGFYENGSVYNHGVAFKLVADCVAGRGNEAYQTLKKLLPSNPKNDFTKSGVEPYALCNMFFGPENEMRPGEAPMHWITGTSSWTFRCIVEYLLGVRAEYDGLLIDPQLPDEWNEVKMTRSFRGATYDITINRTGSRLLTVDGKQYPANVAPVFDDQKVHKVEYTF